jgi:hypothetical protein
MSVAEFEYDAGKTRDWVHAHWRQCLLLARAGAGGGALAMMEGFEEEIDALAGRMSAEDATLFRAAVAEEQTALAQLHAKDHAALYARLGLTEQQLGDIDRQRRARRGLEGQSGCAVLLVAIGLAGALAALA